MAIGEHFPTVLEAARGGAEWAWRLIYRELAPSLLGYFRARRATEPEDLLGEVFLQVVRDVSGFQGSERHFRAWLFKIAHNRLVDARRRDARRLLRPLSDELAQLESVLGDVDPSITSLGDRQWIHGMLGRLSADQQEILWLRLFGDLSVDDVARVVGKRPGAVKGRLEAASLTFRGLPARARILSI